MSGQSANLSSAGGGSGNQPSGASDNQPTGSSDQQPTGGSGNQAVGGSSGKPAPSSGDRPAWDGLQGGGKRPTAYEATFRICCKCHPPGTIGPPFVHKLENLVHDTCPVCGHMVERMCPCKLWFKQRFEQNNDR